MDLFTVGQGGMLTWLTPLLLIPTVWILYRYLLRPWVLPVLLPTSNNRTRLRAGLSLSILLVAGALLASFVPGRQRLLALCAELEPPLILKQVQADGFFHDSLHPFQARELLDRGQFAFIEAPDPYHAKVYLRFTRAAGGGIQETTIARPASEYWVRVQRTELGYDLHRTDKTVLTFPKGERLAQATIIHFEGGPLSGLLGGFARRQCPNADSKEGKAALAEFDQLEARTLGSSAAGPSLTGGVSSQFWFRYEH